MSKRLSKAERRKQMLELFIPAPKPLKQRTSKFAEPAQKPQVQVQVPKLIEQVKDAASQSSPPARALVADKKIEVAVDTNNLKPPAIPSYPPPALPTVLPPSLSILPAKSSIKLVDSENLADLQSLKVEELNFDDGLQFKNAKIPIVDTVLTMGKSKFAYSFFEWKCINTSTSKRLGGIPLPSGEEYLLYFEVAVTPISDALKTGTNADGSDNSNSLETNSYRHNCSVIVCIIDGKTSYKQINVTQSAQSEQGAPQIVVRCETYDKVNGLLIPKITCTTDEQQKLVCSFGVYVSKNNF